MILLIDNYDSFVHNLARYFRLLGCKTAVRRNDAVTASQVRALAPEAIVLSPGPCAPEQAGKSLEIVAELHREYPMLGICLGHQTIAAAFGGRVGRANRPMHGRSTVIRHDQQAVFANIENPLQVARYHSLMVQPESLPNSLVPTAWTEDGVLMAVRHADLPVIGLQFHPESVLTNQGLTMLDNFLKIAGRATRGLAGAGATRR